MFAWRNAFDCYAVRQWMALSLSLPATWMAARLALAGPPAGWSDWPEEARAAVRGTSQGLFGVAFVVWIWAMSWPLARQVQSRMARSAFALASGGLGLPGIWRLFSGLVALAFQSGDFSEAAAWTVGRVAVLPLTVGGSIASWPLLQEHVNANPLFRRLFVRGAASGFAGPVALKKFAGRAPTKGKNGATLSEGVVAGYALNEDSYAGGRPVIIDNSAHVAIEAMPGAGKFLLAGCTLGTYVGSKIVISTKPECADTFLSFACDPDCLPGPSGKPSAGRYGVDLRPLTKVRKHLPGSRGYVLDLGNECVAATNVHCLVSDIDPQEDDARTLIMAVMGACFPDRKNSRSDPWYTECPKGFLSATWLYFRVNDDNRGHWYLPYVIERAAGRDPDTGDAGPEVFSRLVQDMMQCRHPVHGAFIATKAIEVQELGDRAYGAMKSEIITNAGGFVFDPMVRRQLEQPSSFSYRDLGDDENPVSVFIVGPRGTEAMRMALPWLRAHAALSLAILSKRKQRPRVPTTIFLDECRQYLGGVTDFSLGLTLLREARCRLVTFWQSYPSCRQTLGDRVAEELFATSSTLSFGIDCVETATRLSQRLGKIQLRDGQVVDLKSPTEVLRELRINSPLCYLTGGGLPPMRLRRPSFKAVSTKDGLVLPGIGIEGQYDELSKYRYGGRP